ncbi:keratin, type I cytoskeletal 9-like [Sardina pilchardus]|uniref:keratin, type I cytoskeletal 9-like n=1 Tax=Sardina pilchardus TaxID=27697 RepID=UPI002E14E38B
MAYFILVALLLSSAAAYPGGKQQGFGSQNSPSRGSMRPGGSSGRQERPSGGSGMQGGPFGGSGMQIGSLALQDLLREGFGMQGQSNGGFGRQSGGGFGMQDRPSRGFGMQGRPSEGFGMQGSQGSQSMGGGRSRPRRNGRRRPGQRRPRPGQMERDFGSMERDFESMGPDFESMGPDFESMGPDFESMGSDFESMGSDFGDFFPGMDDWDMNAADEWMLWGPDGEGQFDEGCDDGDDPDVPGRGDQRGQGRGRQGQRAPRARAQQGGRGGNRRGQNGRGQGGAGGRLPFGARQVTPEIMELLEFTPIVKADNVTLPINASLPLPEGESVFILPQRRRRPAAGFGQQSIGAQNSQPYVKFNYNPNATAPNPKFAFEYGTLPSSLKASDPIPK